MLLTKLKIDSDSGFHKILTLGPKEKRRILPESTPDPVPPLVYGIGGQSHFFKLGLHSCPKIFESGVKRNF